MRKKIVTVAAIQMKMSEDQRSNLKRAVIKIEEAVARGAQIIRLPELFQTIYFPQKIKKNFDEFAKTVPGEITNIFSSLAKKNKIVIIVPIFEKAKDGNYYNSAAVIDSNGKILETYRKIHIPNDPLFYEGRYFKKGNSGYKIYKTRYATFSVLICFDQWFPEAARVVALSGADIIFNPTAIGNIQNYHSAEGNWEEAWETVQRSHAIANSVHVVSVNRTGAEEKLKFWGQSFICDSFGKIIKRAGKNNEEILISKIDLSKNRKIRDGWGFFRKRRPDTYKKLTDEKN